MLNILGTCLLYLISYCSIKETKGSNIPSQVFSFLTVRKLKQVELCSSFSNTATDLSFSFNVVFHRVDLGTVFFGDNPKKLAPIQCQHWSRLDRN